MRDRARWADSGQAIGGLIAAITVVGLLVRLPSFGNSLFGDELSTYSKVTGSRLGHVVWLLEGGHSGDLNPPLYVIAAWFAERLGDSDQLLPSLLAGVAAIPFTYLLGVRTVGRVSTVVGSALVALSPFLIIFSTEARSFALLMLLTLLSTLALLRAIDGGGVRWWVGYAAFSCAAMYTSYTAAFLLAGQLAWALSTQRQVWGELLVANAGAALCYLPWLPSFIDDSRSPGVKAPELLSPFGLDSLRTQLGRWSIGPPVRRLGDPAR